MCRPLHTTQGHVWLELAGWAGGGESSPLPSPPHGRLPRLSVSCVRLPPICPRCALRYSCVHAQLCDPLRHGRRGGGLLSVYPEPGHEVYVDRRVATPALPPPHSSCSPTITSMWSTFSRILRSRDSLRVPHRPWRRVVSAHRPGGGPVAQLVHPNPHPLHLMLVFSEVASRPCSALRCPLTVRGRRCSSSNDRVSVLQRPRPRQPSWCRHCVYVLCEMPCGGPDHWEGGEAGPVRADCSHLPW